MRWIRENYQPTAVFGQGAMAEEKQGEGFFIQAYAKNE
jgi:hypothetical protein